MITIFLLFVGAVLLIIVVIIGVFLMSRGQVDVNEAKMPLPNTDEDKFVQTLLRSVLIVTVILSFIIRIMTPGWILIIFGIPLLIIVGLHTGILNWAIKKIPATKPIFPYLMIVSNLFFFLGFVLQGDYGDSPGVYIPIFFPFISGVSFPSVSKWPGIFSQISMGCFIALLLSWILLLTLSNSLLKKERLVEVADMDKDYERNHG